MGANRRIKKKLRVAIVSERRADYSRFKPIISLMKNDPFFDYKLIVTGISLLKNYGEDTRAYSRVMHGLSNVFEEIKPDLILTGFDIGANFSAAIVGAHMNIPVAHIQGGEVTGSIDESLRHATSKFAHIHFAATKEAACRLRRMGEDPRFIFVVGCPSIDALVQSPVISRKSVMEILKLNPDQPYVIIVQHPVTSETNQAGRQIKNTLEAVEEVGIQGIALYPNNDAGTRAIISGIHNSCIRYIKSLPSEIFANALRYSEALIGNSSTGIHETATLHIPTINIGTRQQGRERPKNIIDSGYKKEEIKRAIKKALYDKKFKRIVQNVKNPYGDGHSAELIIKILKTLDIKSIPLQKRFID